MSRGFKRVVFVHVNVTCSKSQDCLMNIACRKYEAVVNLPRLEASSILFVFGPTVALTAIIRNTQFAQKCNPTRECEKLLRLPIATWADFLLLSPSPNCAFTRLGFPEFLFYFILLIPSLLFSDLRLRRILLGFLRQLFALLLAKSCSINCVNFFLKIPNLFLHYLNGWIFKFKEVNSRFSEI